MEGIGTCDHTLSRRYARMVEGVGYPCDQFTNSADPPAEKNGPRGPSHRGTTCMDCHYWFPFEMMPRVGQCYNPSSRHYRSSEFSDKPTEECFIEKSLEGLEFMWCQTHRQTIHSSELPDHVGCLVFVSTVSLPVEDQMELTLAGD